MATTKDVERVVGAMEKIVLDARVETAKRVGMDTLFNTGSLGGALSAFAVELAVDNNVISGTAVDPETGRPVSYVVLNPSAEQMQDHHAGILPRVSVASASRV